MAKDIEQTDASEPGQPIAGVVMSLRLVVDDSPAMRAALKASLCAEPLSKFQSPFQNEESFNHAVSDPQDNLCSYDSFLINAPYGGLGGSERLR